MLNNLKNGKNRKNKKMQKNKMEIGKYIGLITSNKLRVRF